MNSERTQGSTARPMYRQLGPGYNQKMTPMIGPDMSVHNVPVYDGIVDPTHGGSGNGSGYHTLKTAYVGNHNCVQRVQRKCWAPAQ